MNILPVIFALFRVVISVCWWKMIGQTGGTLKPVIWRFWYMCCGMYLINFHFTTSYGESVHVVRMKPSYPWWPSKATSVLPQKQMRKVPDQWTRVVWQGHFVLSWSCGTLSINMKSQNLWFKHCLSILIIEKILKITLYVSLQRDVMKN